MISVGVTHPILSIGVPFIAFGATALIVGTVLPRGIPLPLAVVDYEGSTVLVSLNGLRLLSYR